MDIDIDMRSDFNASETFPNTIKAMMQEKNGKIKKHPVGHYFQDIPTDSVTGLAAIPYKLAEDKDYYKIDFLTLNLLDNFESKDEVRQLTMIEPDWDLLLDASIYDDLFQLGGYYTLVSQLRPRSVPDVADCIALIRPGKRDLSNRYISATKQGRLALRQELYKKPVNGAYYFKKSHATAYALTIQLQLHVIKAKMDK